MLVGYASRLQRDRRPVVPLGRRAAPPCQVGPDASSCSRPSANACPPADRRTWVLPRSGGGTATPAAVYDVRHLTSSPPLRRPVPVVAASLDTGGSYGGGRPS